MLDQKSVFKPSICCIVFLLSFVEANSQTGAEIWQWNEIHVREDGGFIRNVLSQGGPQVVGTICKVIGGYDCSREAQRLAQVARGAANAVQRGRNGLEVISLGPNISDDHQNGDQHVFYIYPPNGYGTCPARIDWTGASMSRGTTFSGAIQRDGSFGLNANVPKPAGLAPAGKSVEAGMYVQFVPRGTERENGCWPYIRDFWVCRQSGDNCTFYPGARLADEANYR
jgi:hypothetical protein